MSSSPFWESLVLFATTWNIWRDSDHTRRRRSRILTCCHFITRNTPSSEQERRRQCGANQTKAGCLCIAVTVRPSAARMLRLSSFSVSFLPISPSISPFLSCQRGSMAICNSPARWHLDTHTHTRTHGVQKTLRAIEWTQDRGERIKAGSLGRNTSSFRKWVPSAEGVKSHWTVLMRPLLTSGSPCQTAYICLRTHTFSIWKYLTYSA